MPDSNHSDEALVQAAGKGDMQSFAEIVRRHQNWAWRIAYRFTGNEDEASDIVQEAFLRLLNASSRYRATAKFRTYFYRILSRLCLDRAKKRQPLFLGTIPDVPGACPDVTDTLIRQETANAVRAALDTLSPNQRIAIVLRYYEELNYKEIASALDTTTKAVERLLARGRERLQGILGHRDKFFNS